MRVKTILNNNSVLATLKDGSNVVIIKKGIGYRNKKGDELEENVNEIYVLSASVMSKKYISALEQIPDEVLSISKEIIEYGKNVINRDINEIIYFTLPDHINEVISREKENINIINPLIWNIKDIYPQHYKTGIYGIELLNKTMGLNLDESEAGFIAMHFINATIVGHDKGMEDITSMTILINNILKLVNRQSKKEIDDDSIDYFRFIRHLEFFARRVIHGYEFEEESFNLDMDLCDIVFEKYNKALNIAKSIKNMVDEEYEINVSKEDVFYLTLHINKIIE